MDEKIQTKTNNYDYIIVCAFFPLIKNIAPCMCLFCLKTMKMLGQMNGAGDGVMLYDISHPEWGSDLGSKSLVTPRFCSCNAEALNLPAYAKWIMSDSKVCIVLLKITVLSTCTGRCGFEG